MSDISAFDVDLVGRCTRLNEADRCVKPIAASQMRIVLNRHRNT
jgi:hypothetical protein